MGVSMTTSAAIRQLSLFPGDEAPIKGDTTSTFSDNMSLPIHRWFRYSAGFSALWVRSLIARERDQGRSRVLDPFAGSGTVLLESEVCDAEAIGIEAHPFVTRMASAKLHWRENPKAFRDFALAILKQARQQEGALDDYPKLIRKCFPDETLSRLDTLKRSWELVADGTPYSELAWLALTSILRECSPVGTAQWQYVLPQKSKAKVAEPYEAFETKVHLMSHDMAIRQRETPGPQARLYWEDARERTPVPDAWANLVITSPPYANNYDYADATRLEMSYWGQVQGWGDLQNTVRRYLIRSCTQHVSGMISKTYDLVQEPMLAPISEEITETCRRLALERESHGGSKPYHTMIAAYFSDMARVWHELRRVTAEGAVVCFVVGDSAPYGVYVPVDRWLGELAIFAGFKSYSFEKLRDRNTKWKNRKHRVLLHEGRLWVKG